MNTDDLIIKYLTNENSAEDNAALMDWVLSSEENKKEFAAICRYWYTSGRNKSEKSFDAHNAFSEFKNQTNQETISPQTQTVTPQQKISKTKKSLITPLWRYVAAAAAVVIFVVVSVFVNQNNINQQTIANTSATEKEIILPDGSTIYLHSHSSITYPSEFNKEERTISINGHAFCEITRNEQAPFIVSTPLISVEVLGTTFDVNTNNSKANVIVESGSVQVTELNSNQSVILEKNERVDYEKNETIRTSINTDINYLSWKTGILTFDKTPLHKVFADIERHYNCSIIVSNEQIYSEILTSTFEQLSLEDVCTMISSAFPSISYLKEENTITFYN
ncbi:MAG: FecR family protein [Bacteroidales bacterium]|nr:FecR family protein [Bacteroidales bacterium]